MRRFVSGSIVRELARFAVGGGGVAVVTVAVYWGAVTVLVLPPLIANLIAFLIQLMLGYRVHRTWSFRAGAASAGGLVRFGVVSGAALLLNSLWVWMLTGPGGQAGWTAIAPMVCVTPLFTFALSRRWIFDTGAELRP